MLNRIPGLTALVLAVVLSVAVPAAHAQSATERGYDESGGVIGELQDLDTLDNGGSPNTTAGSTDEKNPDSGELTPSGSSGSLPFTGLDLAVVALMGLALLATGVSLRRGTGTARR